MSLPTASAALGIAVLASTGLASFGLPEPAPTAPRAVIVPVAALQQPLILVPPGTAVMQDAQAMPQRPQQYAATTDEDKTAPRFGGPKSSPTPLVTPPAMRAPQTMPAAQPVPAAQPAPAMQPVPTMPRPAQQQRPAAMPAAATPATMPTARPTPAQAMPVQAARSEMPRQVHGFDGIVASERALLQKTASTARYEAHIASAATEMEADRLWSALREKLDQRHSNAVAHFKLIDVPGHGRFVRILVGDFNDAAATADFCRAVIAQGSDCRILRQLENKS
ncbi:SPOR domain-containing protein [Ferrovibrio sp.]|uniref:SPOR domain-containing protein n=1 Tax=Ferrovibrio sp. TaxID=1917215 RepID=UPI0025BF6010|nr:SPOR domain-containing protein [Ferrovibrio sp.]MBX3455901.1 SPOR domain-containing protein [Ferrovibrio sp.]